MRGDGDHRDRRDAQRDVADPMDDRESRHPEPLGDLVAMVVEDADRHRVVGLVLEGIDRPAGMARGLRLLAGRRRPGLERVRPRNPTMAPSAVGREPVAELPEDLGAERGLAQLDDPEWVRPVRAVRRVPAPSPGAPEPPDTGGMTASSSPSARVSAGSA